MYREGTLPVDSLDVMCIPRMGRETRHRLDPGEGGGGGGTQGC